MTLTKERAVYDQTDFAAAFDEHHRALHRLAFLLCSDRTRAEDLVAEAFARVYPRWRKGGIEDLGPYLRQAVVNQARGRWRRKALEDREEARQTGDGRGGRLFDDTAVDRDELRVALASLPIKQRTAIVLRYFEDCTEAETARLMETSVGTVKSQVSRGLDRLKGVLEDGRKS
ncbi:MAG TPA: SigE family RNA polymerase sigma factor [Acidimicrobiales bacterium]|nr:SigE family RNA polymerase sigma factor [Acidimicrobiales bacterium]